MLQVNISSQYDVYATETLTQWDTFQNLSLLGISGTISVLFFNRIQGTADPVEARRSDNSYTVSIPNGLLTQPYPIIAYVRSRSGSTYTTIAKIKIPVIASAKPEDYEYIENISLYTYEDLLEEISNKASIKELEIEKSRIDNLLSLPEGSTTNDAEVADIRVGADGKTYKSAGESVRTQFDNLNEKLKNLNNAGVFYDDNGNKYSASILEDEIVLREKVEMVTYGLTQNILVEKNDNNSLVYHELLSDTILSNYLDLSKCKTAILIITMPFSGRMPYRAWGDSSHADGVFTHQGIVTKKPWFNSQYPIGNDFRKAVIFTKLIDSKKLYLNENLCPGYINVSSAISDIATVYEGERILTYDRELTEDEIIRNCKYFGTNVPYTGSFTVDNFSGINGITPGNKYSINGSIVNTIDDLENIKDGVFEDNEINTTSITYDELLICGNCDTIYVGYPYALSVYPKNYRLGDTLHFSYESSNSDICAVYAGILFPKKEGTFDLTVTYNGTSLSVTKTIIVETHPNDKEPVNVIKYRPVSGNFCESMNAFLNGLTFNELTRIECTKGTYIIDIPAEKGTIEIPSNCIIDFQDSTLIINPNIRSFVNQSSFRLFTMSGKNSLIRNFHIIGDKESSGSGEKNHYSAAIHFNETARFCGAEHFTVEHMTGMGITGDSTAYTYWNGIADSSRGRMNYDQFSLGDLNESGEVITSDCNYVTEMIEIGYDEDYINSRDRLFTIGRKGYGGYPGLARTYRICFYNSDREFISYVDSMLYEAINIPENVAYFRVALYMNTAPSSNTGEDNMFLRLYEYTGCIYCHCSDFYYYDPSYSVCSVSTNNFYLRRGLGGPSGIWKWTVDFEDGFSNMTHNVLVDCVFSTKTCFVGGRSNSIINHRGILNIANDVENSYIVGGNIGYSALNQKDRILLSDCIFTSDVSASDYLNTIIDLSTSS